MISHVRLCLRDLMEANGMSPPSPIAKGSLVTTMSSPIGAGSLGIPDNLTIPQFFYVSHVSRPSFSGDGTPCLVDEQTGRTLSFADVSVLPFARRDTSCPSP